MRPIRHFSGDRSRDSGNYVSQSSGQRLPRGSIAGLQQLRRSMAALRRLRAALWASSSVGVSGRAEEHHLQLIMAFDDTRQSYVCSLSGVSFCVLFCNLYMESLWCFLTDKKTDACLIINVGICIMMMYQFSKLCVYFSFERCVFWKMCALVQHQASSSNCVLKSAITVVAGREVITCRPSSVHWVLVRIWLFRWRIFDRILLQIWGCFLRKTSQCGSVLEILMTRLSSTFQK